MLAKKTHPNHVKTRLYSEVERAIKRGQREVMIHIPWLNGGRKKPIAAMHIMQNRILFFDPALNPTLSYGVECDVPVGLIIEDGISPKRQYEGNGLFSIDLDSLKDFFYEGKAYALIPRSFTLAV
jgi:hypothetical protein